ncbi:Ubiquitin-specific protease [Spatholobus suberectus]|nr:Ubiquitin-specific protease [Spatholobus suberectus]
MLPLNHGRVGIEVSFEGDTPLSIPAQSKGKSKEIKELRQSKELITTPVKNQPKSALPSFPVGGADNQLDRLPPSCKLLDRYIRKLLMGGEQLTICMEKYIFNFEYQEMIGQEQINELLYQKQIGASVMSVYIRYLFHSWLVPKQMLTRFSFLCPHKMALPLTNNLEYNYKHFKTSQYIAEVLIANEKRKKVFLAPYNTGEHWVLIVINTDAKIVYYLDPMHGDFEDHSEMKRLFNFALTIYHSGDYNIKWIQIKCPRQTNNKDCGYSVLRFMKEIISHNKSTIPEMYFSDCRFNFYSQDQIDEIREEWSSYVFDHCT